MNPIEQLSEWIRGAGSIVALTGAGISTGSGIPDFRSASGIYSDSRNVNVFDLDAFSRNPGIFYTFARAFYPQVRDAHPNAAHRALAEWQRQGKELVVVTQNVDDYHQRAGSVPVYSVHGNHIYSSCQRCGDRVETETLHSLIETGEIPRCSCGGVYKPDITFFGEMLPEYDWNASVRAISRCDLLLVLGTSLTVYPAAGLPGYRPLNCRMVIINHDPTPLDAEAQLVIHDDLCNVMEKLSALISC
ncbi:MAG: Sir2 family NAD-dependent protein deacetylase [Pontiellaceae bacterium]|nr:Sir2 family NAD-dependent protein deacetylase [Pontiellaceae bacterium]MBN2785774.1 Sir2 family NAD-dependent protein deacetylase [Pontiellaceae bacterium]